MDKNNSPQKKNTTAQFLIFTAETGNPKIEVRIEGEMAWLTQKLMAKLFDVSVPTINEYLKNIYNSQELVELSTIRKFLIVQNEGGRDVSREIEHYNLDAVIAVGYRVNSKQATHFRIWATQVLRNFIIKGFALDDERLKQGKNLFNIDYFRELLERVRSIAGFFDYIENLIERNNTFTMKQFAESVNKFLTFNEYKILDGKGRISKTDADARAISEYGEFNKHQKIESDFDKEIKKIMSENKPGLTNDSNWC